MAAQLINGNGFEGCTAQVDADFYEGIFGTETGILTVGQKMRAEMVNNQPRVYDGVILTKEGRRIQIDYGTYQDFAIPAGTTGVTAYYIIGFKLVTNSDDTQTCEPFVRAVSGPSTTITEGELRSGAAEVYVSLYRVTQVGTTNVLGNRMLEELSHLYGKIYRSLADVGLTKPTTVNVYYGYMADNSVAILTEAEISDLPYENASGICVIIRKDATHGKAFFFSEGGKPNYQYYMSESNGVWIPLASEDDVYYTYGHNSGGVPNKYQLRFGLGGYITNDGQDILAYIPLNRRVPDGYKLEFNRRVGGVTVRQNGKYLIGSGTSSNDFESDVYTTCATYENLAVFTIHREGGYGGVNNAPVAVQGWAEVWIDVR